MNKALLKDMIQTVTPTIIEVGAHHGEDTAHFCMLYPHGHVYVFEPDVRNIAIINKLHLNCELFMGAMNDYDGTVQFHACNDAYNGSGSILLPGVHMNIWPDCEFVETYDVPSITLKTFVQIHKIDVIDFMWADVQGAEEKIIMGGLKEFHTKVRYLYTEYCQTELYVGCPTRERILSLLPMFEVVSDVGSWVCGDMLLKNTSLVS